MNQERMHKLLDNSLVKIEFLKKDMQKMLDELNIQRDKGDFDGKTKEK